MQALKALPSRLHSKLTEEPVWLEVKPKLAEVLLVGFAGCEDIVVSTSGLKFAYSSKLLAGPGMHASAA